MIVVKPGGSLFDHPNLRVGLNRWLEQQQTEILLVPGGGSVADAVREFDRIHALGEEVAHWAALRSLTVTADLVAPFVKCENVHIVNLYKFCREHDDLPHSWDVTTDSLAAQVAIQQNAKKLVLLKSEDRPTDSWQELAERGFVDRYFPKLAEQAKMSIEVVNFRRWLDHG